jgi:hypothetical protein
VKGGRYGNGDPGLTAGLDMKSRDIWDSRGGGGGRGRYIWEVRW